MKTFVILITLAGFLPINILSQSCLPEGITFDTQSQIDSFQVNYPGCKEVEGSVQIIGMGISNLSGLNCVNSINGELIINWTYLVNLSGLDSLTNIGGGLEIGGNIYLTNFSGLGSLSVIHGDLDIKYNSDLTSISELSNLTADSLINLYINHNFNLSDCEAQGLCDYLSNPSGVIEIYNNAEGCLNPGEISDNCGIVLPCLPYGNYYFLSQVEIDSFQVDYPGCAGLNGYVQISGYDITSLEGLIDLTSVFGDLDIIDNHNLTSLDGLNNIDNVEGFLHLIDNTDLLSLNGLENLTYIGADLRIIWCHSLNNLSGLEELNSINGDMEIRFNTDLNSLTGLDNLNAGTIDNLIIYGNDLLSDCEVQSVCTYLADPSGVVNIYDNASGCNNPPEVANGCGISLPCLPYGNYYFLTQQEIDSFKTNYPDCTGLKGNVLIVGDDISNLEGLYIIDSIEADLRIGSNSYQGSNPNLEDLTGLEGLISIGRDLIILKNLNLNSLDGLDHLNTVGRNLDIAQCEELTNIAALEELEYIGGWLVIQNSLLENFHGLEAVVSLGGDLFIADNNNLAKLIGLENIDSIGGGLYIVSNNTLSTLSELAGLTKISGELYIRYNSGLLNLIGLENISSTSIEGLYIFENPSLSACAVESICNYLTTPNSSPVEIHDNAPGCDSPEEVFLKCLARITDTCSEAAFSIYPNPAEGEVFISSRLEAVLKEIFIYNLQGQQVFYNRGDINKLDISMLPGGIYLLKLISDNLIFNIKLIVQN